jgi:CRP-like cAMP-binding protein
VVDQEVAARVGREVFLLSLGGDARLLGWAFPRFVRALSDVYLEAGEVVYRRGDPSDAQFFIVSGEVALELEGTKPLVMGERGLVGTLDMLLDRPHKRTATATAPTHLLRMPAEDWWTLIEDRLDLAQRIITNVSGGIQALRSRPAPLGGFDAPWATPARARPKGLNLVERITLLRAVPLFGRASIQALTTLAELATEVQAAPGDVLVPAHATRRSLVVVAWGQVVASRPGSDLSGRFGAGSLVCGPVALDPAADYEVRADGPVVALTLPFTEYFDTMEEHFSLVRSALMAVAEERDTLLDRQ